MGFSVVVDVWIWYFLVQQLTEKAVEHHEKQFLIFMDLHKVYDSVPHEALWMALEKLGVPAVLIDIINSFHADRVKVDSELSEEIWVSNGLKQGCTMTPTLFNLYYCEVAETGLKRKRV